MEGLVLKHAKAKKQGIQRLTYLRTPCVKMKGNTVVLVVNMQIID